MLLKRISSRMWDSDVSDIAVVLAGYDRVLSASRVAVNAVVGGGGGGVHGLP